MNEEQLKKLKEWRTYLSATLVLEGHKMGEELQNEVRDYRNLLSDGIEQIELLKRKVQELDLEISELQRGYDDSQKEIVTLKNEIRRLKNDSI